MRIYLGHEAGYDVGTAVRSVRDRERHAGYLAAAVGVQESLEQAWSAFTGDELIKAPTGYAVRRYAEEARTAIAAVQEFGAFIEFEPGHKWICTACPLHCTI